MLLYNYIATTIEKTALDVRIGFLHATNSREESLNLDVAELFKPLIVDRIALTLVNRRQLQRDRHFTREENGGWYLNTEGKRIYLELFNDKLNSRVTVGKSSVPYTDIIRDEVNKLVRHFKSGEKYKPFKQIR